MPKKRRGAAGSRPRVLRFAVQGEIVEIDLADPSYFVFETEAFSDWLEEIRSRDASTGADLERAVDKFERGVFGDWKPVGGQVREMRVDLGPGYRVYFACHARYIILLIAGSTKDDQRRLIQKAIEVWKEIKHEITPL